MIHNKGLVIDGGKVLVSSINWNENSIMNNREIGLIIEGEAAAYYGEVFNYDWEGKPEEYGFGFWPAMLSLAALVVVILYFWKRNS
jgi:phosphatidylserine/phosphatidylglycerophosphate/cardiolipin synthase-like enzyme